MRSMFAVFATLSLAACQMPPQQQQTRDIPEPPQYQQLGQPLEVGSFEWMDMVSRRSGVLDGHGGGPDYGSQEWCDAVHFRVFGQRPETPVSCDPSWMQEIDQRLRSL